MKPRGELLVATGDRRFRVVVAGCGRVSWAWVESALACCDCEFVAVVDPLEGRASELAARYCLGCPAFTRLGDALARVDANLVLDLSPPDQHLAVATEAAKARCCVLAEKPLASSLLEGLAIAERMAEGGGAYAVMQNRRYYPGLRSLRRVIAEGLIGEVSFVAVDLFRAPRPGGFREKMAQPLLWDLGIHAFDATRYLLGADAVSVSAFTANPSWSWYEGDALADCVFQMSNGAVLAYRGSMCAAGFSTTFNGAWRVVGSLGTACWDGQSEAVEVESASEDRSRTEFRAPPDDRNIDSDLAALGSYHGACFHEMITALVAGRRSATDIEDNLHSMAMVEGAVLSAEQGRTVRLNELGPLVVGRGAGLGRDSPLGSPSGGPANAMYGPGPSGFRPIENDK